MKKIDDLDEGESSDSSIESSYCELSLKRSAVNIKKINIRGHLKQLIDLAYTKSDLKVIEELESRVKKLLQDFTQKATQGEMNGLPQSNAAQPAFTCSKVTIETLKQGVKYVQS